MADPFVGEIKMFAGVFAPLGWLDCNGQLVSIGEFPTLFTLIGTTDGGDGVNHFQLPNLQSRVPVGTGTGYPLGSDGGVEVVTLTGQQVPAHTHPLVATTSGQQRSPANAVPAVLPDARYWAYGPKTTATTLIPESVGYGGGTGPHDNLQPYLGMRFIIAMDGAFPPPP